MKRIVLWGCWFLAVTLFAQAQSSQQIPIKVVDENGVPISDARVVLTNSEGSDFRCQTIASGRCNLLLDSTGPYKAKVEREGFYAISANDIQLDPNKNIEFTLVHERDIFES